MPAGQGSWTPWRVVVWFGVVSLAADMVYEGARSMYGPLLAALGASATVVGPVTGAGEAMALVLRLVFAHVAQCCPLVLRALRLDAIGSTCPVGGRLGPARAGRREGSSGAVVSRRH